jgi:tetratricopeptide (TPR) repeat protein
MRHTLVSSLLGVALVAFAGRAWAGDPGNQAYVEGRYAEAAKHFSKTLETDPDESGITTFNLAAVYRAQARYTEAEPLYRKAIALRESTLGVRDPSLVKPLDGLALTCQGLGRLAEAEELAARAMAIQSTGRTANILAFILAERGAYRQAASLARRADSAAGLSPIEHAELLSTLAFVNRHQNRYAKAETLYRESAAIFERELGPGAPTTAVVWNNLAQVLTTQGHLMEAHALSDRAIAVLERAWGQDDSRVAAIRHNQASLNNALFVNLPRQSVTAAAFTAQAQVPHCRPETCPQE